jgi:hypothetical protein
MAYGQILVPPHFKYELMLLGVSGFSSLNGTLMVAFSGTRLG